MNRSKSVGFFHIEMASRTDTALDQLNHVINTTFSSIRKFEPFERYTTLQSLYRALDHQLQDGSMGQQESDCMRFIVRKLWDLKLQIHMIERNVHNCLMACYLVDATLVLGGSLFVYACTPLYSR